MLATIGSDAAVSAPAGARSPLQATRCSSAPRRRAPSARTANFTDIGRLLGGIASIQSDPEQIERILDIVLDGLRYQPAAS